MIDRKDIEHLATLSRIKLTEEETVSFQKEIDSILGYIGTIQKVSSSVPADVAIPRAHNVLREDTPDKKGGEYTEALIEAAPFSEGNSVKVKNMF